MEAFYVWLASGKPAGQRHVIGIATIDFGCPYGVATVQKWPASS